MTKDIKLRSQSIKSQVQGPVQFHCLHTGDTNRSGDASNVYQEHGLKGMVGVQIFWGAL